MVKMYTTITDVGVKLNVIDSVTIYDSKGNNVTKYYDITFAPGRLTVY